MGSRLQCGCWGLNAGRRCLLAGAVGWGLCWGGRLGVSLISHPIGLISHPISLIRSVDLICSIECSITFIYPIILYYVINSFYPISFDHFIIH